MMYNQSIVRGKEIQMKHIKTLLVLFILIFALSIGVLAQEATETPTDVPADIENSTPIDVPVPSEDVPQEAVTWLEQIAFASMLVTALVGISKFIPVLNQFAPQKIALVLNLVIWVIFILVQQSGNAEVFIAYVTDFGKLADTFMRIVTTYLGGAGVYHMAKASKFPVLGKVKA